MRHNNQRNQEARKTQYNDFNNYWSQYQLQKA